MDFPERKTLKTSLFLEGPGLHTGEKSRITIHPEDTGGTLVFQYKDVKIPAVLEFAYSEGRSTCLKRDDCKILTIEHFLAACTGVFLTDGVVELTGSGEIPALDGSAVQFLAALLSTGFESIGHASVLKITDKLEVTWSSGNRRYRVREHEGLAIRCVIEFPVASIGRQSFTYSREGTDFLREIAPAKTFVLEKDIAHLRAKGLAKGGSEKNALVYSDSGLLNPRAAAFRDEPVRHKILDFLGDLYLLGAHVKGLFDVMAPGHPYNLSFFKLLKKKAAIRPADPEG